MRLALLVACSVASLRAQAPPKPDSAPAKLTSVIISATRTERRVSDTPLRVEVLEREEIEEKMLMTPGDISMMMNETGGLRVQTTSPSLGAANVRVQGLRGRYTLMLSDGLPLYGGQSGGLGLLQIPPMDLARVEVIKGVASALYGASALGGVINLVSRRPSDEGDHELLINQMTLVASDAVLWSSRQVTPSVGYTFLGGAHSQGRRDRDGDRWFDIPDYRRFVARPKLFWKSARGNNALLTLGVTSEIRRGGEFDIPGDPGYIESLETNRFDAGVIARMPFAAGLVTARASGVVQNHDHQFGGARERDDHRTGFAEITATGVKGRVTGVAGAALQLEDYAATDVPRFDYAHTIPAAFTQADVELTPRLALSASGRADFHSEVGTLINPRVSLLARVGSEWTARLSSGTGSFAPTPFTEETEATGLTPLRALPGLDPERATSASLDVGGPIGAFEVSGAVFASRIRNALIVRPPAGAPTELEIVNATSPTRTVGADVMLRYRVEGVTSTLTYTRVHAREETPETGDERTVPLTPAHAAGFVSVWEEEGKTRVGLEVYYTGHQFLADNPFRTTSPSYFIAGLIAERRVGRARWFVNFENATNYRITKVHPLARSTPGPGGRRTIDAWGPTDGFTVNGGVRVALGKVRDD